MKIGRANANGFTLIELMIAVTIFAFIALSVYTSTSQSFILRENLEQEGDFYNGVRVALDVFGRDVTQIYSPQSAALPGGLGKPAAAPGGNLAQPVDQRMQETLPFWTPAINNAGVRASRFVGEETKMTFISSSNVRLFRDSRDSDFLKVTYALEDDKLGERGQKALVKHQDPDVFDILGRPGDNEVEFALISNVKSLKFQYLDGEKDRWYNSWDNTGMDHKDKFPSIIEIKIEVMPPRSENSLVVTQRYRPELPL